MSSREAIWTLEKAQGSPEWQSIFYQSFLEHKMAENQKVSKRLADRLYRLLVESDMLTTRLALMVGSILWGLFLLWPNSHTFQDSDYRLMAQIATQSVWGWLFTIQGLVMFMSLFSEFENKYVTFIDALFGCLLWTAATTLFISESIRLGQFQAVISTEIVFTLTSWWHLVRSMLEIHRSKRWPQKP